MIVELFALKLDSNIEVEVNFIVNVYWHIENFIKRADAALLALIWRDGESCLDLTRVHPLPSNRHHRSSDDCLEGKGENYQVCSVQYCVQELCTVQCTHTHEQTNRSLDWVLSHLAHFTVLRFIFVYVCKCMHFLYDCILHECVVIVTW